MIPKEYYEGLVSELEIQTEKEIGYIIQLLKERDPSKIPCYRKQIEETGAMRAAITEDLCEKLQQEEERIIMGDLGDIAERAVELFTRFIGFYRNLNSAIEAYERRKRTLH